MTGSKSVTIAPENGPIYNKEHNKDNNTKTIDAVLVLTV